MSEEPNVSLLSVSGLTKHFPIKGSRQVVAAVNDVSFTVAAGETLGLVGESGSGKTTVGRCVLRLVEPNAGTIVFAGKTLSGIPMREFRPYRSRLQLVFQDPYHSLDPRRRLGDSVAEPMQLLPNLSRAQKRKRVRELLQRVRLNPEIADAYPHQLSAGQQQRVGIARAMASEPRLIVLDEPTSSLDITVRGEIVELLGRLQRDLGLAYLFISHDLSTIEHLCHRVAVMYLSRIVETGATEQIFHHPRHPYTKALLSSVLPPDPTVAQTVIELAGEIPSPINLPVGCYLSSRCPAARPACHTTRPELLDIGKGHRVACLRVQDGSLPKDWTPDASEPLAIVRDVAS
jgi:oligopeptide/dipeptide ABC transporter ATP-binding protein